MNNPQFRNKLYSKLYGPCGLRFERVFRSKMKLAELKLFLTSFSDTFIRTHGIGMARYYQLPMAYYTPSNVFVFSKPDLLEQRLKSYRHHLQEHGVVRLVPTKITVVDATPHRALVELVWEYVDGHGDVLRNAEARYVLHRDRTEGDLRIELIDYSRVAFPQFLEQPSSSNAV